MNYFILYFCVLFSFSLCQEQSSTSSIPEDLKSLFGNVTLSPVPNEMPKPGENFAEGGSHNSNKLETVSTTKTTLSKPLNSSIDLIDNGAPSGTSGIKPRKGVHIKTIVARKGAPPCLEAADCKPLTAVPAATETSPPPVHEPSTSEGDSSVLQNATRGATTVKATTPTPLPLKPTITLIPSDSDTLYNALKTERNVVIPIVALVCAPIIVMVCLIVFKRVQDARGNSQYMPMGFLIEDIYND